MLTNSIFNFGIEEKLKKILYIILISCFSITIFSCAKKDSTSSTTSSPLYVAVGDNGTILTSSDASTWTSRTSGVTENLYGVTYANSTFVIMGIHQEPSLPLRMELHGLQGLREQMMPSIEAPTETVRSLWLVIIQLVLELSSLHQMEPHGLQGLLEHQIASLKSHTQTVPS